MLARLLAWVRRAPDVIADGARADGPIAWIRADDGGLTRVRLREAGITKIFVTGQPHEHVDTDAEGVWIYAARTY